MNNEPVAWMSQGGDVTRSRNYFEEMGFKDLIPLYTHPAKTLTDEKISKEIYKWFENDLLDEHDYKLAMIKAILKKASER